MRPTFFPLILFERIKITLRKIALQNKHKNSTSNTLYKESQIQKSPYLLIEKDFKMMGPVGLQILTRQGRLVLKLKAVNAKKQRTKD